MNFNTSYFATGANFVINEMIHKKAVNITSFNRMPMSLNYRIPPEIKL